MSFCCLRALLTLGLQTPPPSAPSPRPPQAQASYVTSWGMGLVLGGLTLVVASQAAGGCTRAPGVRSECGLASRPLGVGCLLLACLLMGGLRLKRQLRAAAWMGFLARRTSKGHREASAWWHVRTCPSESGSPLHSKGARTKAAFRGGRCDDFGAGACPNAGRARRAPPPRPRARAGGYSTIWTYASEVQPLASRSLVFGLAVAIYEVRPARGSCAPPPRPRLCQGRPLSFAARKPQRTWQNPQTDVIHARKSHRIKKSFDFFVGFEKKVNRAR
jgi:hypothetical protein